MAKVVAPSRTPRVAVIAGPNGAGKTTYAKVLLERLGIEHFVNADVIAQGLSGMNPASVAIEAGRLMLGRIRDLANSRSDFAFESTLSSRSFALFLRNLKISGYRIELYYLALASPQLAQKRVRLRVKLGGHSIPEDVVSRRFYRSLSNLFELYLPLANTWTIFDNADTKTPSTIAVKFERVQGIVNQHKWQRLQEMAQKAK